MDQNSKNQDNQQLYQKIFSGTYTQPANQTGWSYNSGKLDGQQTDDTPITNDTQEVLAEWSAHEFIHHEKSPKWFALLFLATVLLSGLIYLITRDVLSVVVILVLGLVFGVFANAKPDVIDYKLTPSGLITGKKPLLFTDYKSFSVIQDTAIPYIQLIPRKKFMISYAVFVDPNDADKIVELLGNYLPYDQKQRDIVDKLAAKIRY